MDLISNVISAISASSGIVAVYSPTPSISSIDSKERLVVKCYDSKVSLGTLKFTLVANLPSSNSSNSSSGTSGSRTVSQLFFCGAQDDYLVATLSTSSLTAKSTNEPSTTHKDPVIVWDLKRGVVCHTIHLPKHSILCTATASQHSTQHQHLYLLAKNVESSKLIVYVHDLTTDSAKVVKKVKIGSCDSHTNNIDTTIFSMALYEHQHNNLIAVQHGKRIKISPLTKSAPPAIKCKIKQSVSPSTHDHSPITTPTANNLAFSQDGTTIIVTHSNGLLFFSTHDGKEKGSAPLISPSSSTIPDFSQCDLQVHNNTNATPHHTNNDTTDILLAVTQQAAGRASLFHIKTQSLKKNMTHFATLTSSTDEDATGNNNNNNHNQTTRPNKILHRVFVPRGKRGRNNLLLLELTPRGLLGDVHVHLSEVQYRATATNDRDDSHGRPLEQEDVTNSSLLQGELYPDGTDTSKDAHATTNKITTTTTNTNTAQSKKKRKMSNIVLGPGEGGAEAMNVTDSTALLKKRKIQPDAKPISDEEDTNDEFDFLNTTTLTDEQDGNREASDGTTIAERLALLSSELDRDSDEDNEGTNNQNELLHPRNGIVPSSKNTPKPITSDSLLTLLRQALVSNDDTQLEIALQVSDKKMITNSIDALCAESMQEEFSGTNLVMTLLSKLTTRLSRKAGRAESLSHWVSATLLALISPQSESWGSGGSGTTSLLLGMGTTQREVATHLGPLRNMLSERVESLPSLLRLEGRLGLLGKLS